MEQENVSKNQYFTGDLPWVITGKYASCNCYIRSYDEEVLSQVYKLLDCPAFKGQQLALMPDAHVGASGPCGLVATIGDYVCPEHIGVDIGCSVSVMLLDKPIPEEKYADWEHKVKQTIPSGKNINERSVIVDKDFYKFLTNGFNKYRNYWPEMLGDLPSKVDEKWISDVLKRIGMDEGYFYKSLGTIGGGNHFIEYGEDENKEHSGVILHFGSRNFGLKVCKYWMTFTTSPMSKAERKDKEREITAKFKEEWKKSGKSMREFKDALKKHVTAEMEKLENQEGFVRGYLTGDLMKSYLQDMCLAQLYAEYNHIVVQNRIKDMLLIYGVKVESSLKSVHNFIDLHDHCLRKSAIRAYEEDGLMVIPFNMKDGTAICKGKSNPMWLNSAPHGAGRSYSRGEAKRLLERATRYFELLDAGKDVSGFSDDEVKLLTEFSMKNFKDEMKDVYSTSVCESTIDEAPFVYKSSTEIQSVMEPDTCDVLYLLKPKINIKATDGEATAA